MNEMPPDPFVINPGDMESVVKAMVTLYSMLIQHGLPEQRAYDLIHDLLFIQVSNGA